MPRGAMAGLRQDTIPWAGLRSSLYPRFPRILTLARFAIGRSFVETRGLNEDKWTCTHIEQQAPGHSLPALRNARQGSRSNYGKAQTLLCGEATIIVHHNYRS